MASGTQDTQPTSVAVQYRQDTGSSANDTPAGAASGAVVKQEPDVDVEHVSKRRKVPSAEAQAAMAIIAATARLPSQVTALLSADLAFFSHV